MAVGKQVEHRTIAHGLEVDVRGLAITYWVESSCGGLRTSEQVRSNFVAETQCLLGRNGFAVFPLRNSARLDAEGARKARSVVAEGGESLLFENGRVGHGLSISALI